VSTIIRLSTICTLLALIALPALAGTGGSSYSLFGIGDLRYIPNARSAGMGYTGLALPSPNYINSIQPAAWSRINRVRLEAGLLYEGYKASDKDRSLYLANADFSGALLAIPISTDKGIVTVLGFTPYSNVNYDLFVKGSQQGMDYQLNYTGAGGVSRGIAGLSYAPVAGLSLGASFNYLFGSIDKATTLSPLNSAPDGGTYGNSVSTGSVTMHGITMTLGGQFNGFDSFSETLKPLSIGFMVTSSTSMQTQEDTRYQFLTGRDTITHPNGSLTVPLSYGVGLAYQAGDRTLLAADFLAQNWGTATFDGVDPAEIRNMYRIGVGAERLPARDASTWFGRLVYRLGGFYHSTYYKINTTAINEWGITAGMSMPLFGEARMNGAFEYGSRGTIDNGLVRDRFFRVTLSVTLSELWFQRFEED
jgi:hypothetical protein